MKITFVGTSHGKPQADRYCSSYMLEVGNGIYFVDAGTSFFCAMRDYGMDPTRLRAVFTTHAHGDHTGGLVHGISTLVTRHPDLHFTVALTSQAMIDAYRGYIGVTLGMPGGVDPLAGVALTLAACGEVYRDENLTVTYHKTAHLAGIGEPSYGIIVRENGGGGASILFSGDLSSALSAGDFPTAEASEPHELFVCELAHFYPEHLEPHLAAARVQRVAITHMNEPAKKTPLVEQMAHRLTIPVWIVQDGEALELSKNGGDRL